MKKTSMLVVALFFLAASMLMGSVSVCHAQTYDMWTFEMQKDGLFTPHRDTCNSTTEVFVQMGQFSNRGFCIEKDERTAAEFNDARQTCAALGKRLPEPAEWTQACLNGGLNNMTGAWEWTSNFLKYLVDSTGSNGIHGVVSGYSGCRHSTVAEVWAQNHTAYSYAFRCVS